MRTFSASRSAAVFCVVIGVFVFASSAPAALPRVHLTVDGLPVLPQTNTVLRFDIVEGPQEVLCQQSYKGEINNDRPRLSDTLAEPGEVFVNGCFQQEPTFENHPPGYSTAGGFTKLRLGWNGHVVTIGKDQIAMPGPCVYLFKEVTAEMPVPGFVSFAGNATGALVRKGSLITCPVVRTITFSALIIMNNVESSTDVAETHLIG